MRQARPFAVVALACATLCLTTAHAQTQQGPAARLSASSAHGDPRGWKFTLPSGGDAARGRAVFEKFECYTCHLVKGEKFAAPSQRDAIGPDLSSMSEHHSTGFLAESIVNPSAFVDKGLGYASPDGTSKMPSFNDSMTIQELVDLVAYLKGLATSSAPAAQGHRH